MKVWLIEYSNYTPDVCADEKSVWAHLKKLGLSDEEIEKAFLDGVHIEDDENYDIGETWIKIWPNHDVIQYNVEESHRPRGRMLKEWYQASEEEVERRKKTLIGKLLKNIYIDGEYGYRSEGICTSVDDSGQIHGTWGVAIQPGTDSFDVGSDEDLANYNRKKAEPQENTRKYFDDVKVTITPRKGYGLAAKIDCVYHGQEVKNIKVYEGLKGPFVGYPTWDVIARDPSQKTIRNIWGGCWGEFEKEVIKEYNKAMEEKNESLLRPGRMLKEEDERVSLDVSVSDEWSEDGKKYMELEVKKNGKKTPVDVCVVFTDKGEHLDTIFYNTEKNNEDLTENEVAEELDVSVGDIKKLVEKAKIEAMKEFE